MNTRQKGTTFEDRVYDRIKSEIAAREFGLDPKKVIYKRPARYFSRDREKDIEFDLAFELRLENTGAALLTFVVECKNYDTPIPVNDVEEFKAKLDQCFGKNVKGIIVTSSVLQKSALTYAQSQGIAVIRLLDDEKLNYVSFFMIGGGGETERMSDEYARQVPDALLNPGFTSMACAFGTFNMFIADGEKHYVSLARMLGDYISLNK